MCGVDHDQHLHDVIVDRFGGWLNDEYVAGADVFEDFYEGVVVGEFEDVGVTDVDAEVVADFLGQAFVGRPGQDYWASVNGVHRCGDRRRVLQVNQVTKFDSSTMRLSEPGITGI